MKKTLLRLTAIHAIGTGLMGFSAVVFADAAGELQSRLNQVHVLSADFTQTVTSAGGKNVQQGSGKIQIKRPNYSVWILNCHRKLKLLPMVKPFGITILSCNK